MAALPATPSFPPAPTKEPLLLSELCPTQESSARERSPGPAAASLLSADTASELPTLSVGSSCAACGVASLLLSTAFSSMPALPGPATLDLREDRRRQGRHPLPAVPVHRGGPGRAGSGPRSRRGPIPGDPEHPHGGPGATRRPRSRHAPRPRPAFGRHLAAGSPPPPPRARTRQGGPGAAGAGETPPRRGERVPAPLPARRPAPSPGPPRPSRASAAAGTTEAAIPPRPLAAQRYGGAGPAPGLFTAAQPQPRLQRSPRRKCTPRPGRRLRRLPAPPPPCGRGEASAPHRELFSPRKSRRW